MSKAKQILEQTLKENIESYGEICNDCNTVEDFCICTHKISWHNSANRLPSHGARIMVEGEGDKVFKYDMYVKPFSGSYKGKKWSYVVR